MGYVYDQADACKLTYYTKMALLFSLIVLLASIEIMFVAGQSGDDNIQCEQHRDFYAKCQWQCPSNCTCTLDNTTVIGNCTERSSFKTQVVYPSGEVTWLSWDGSNMHRIEPGSFGKFANSLLVLNLSYNALGHIKDGVFDELSTLEYLYLDNNVLSVLQGGLFEGLMNLKALWLYKNSLYEIHWDAFKGLVSLEWLDLSNNALLHDLQPGVFNGLSLSSLRLHNCALREVQSAGLFDTLTDLEELDLSGNAIHNLQSDAFDNLTSLKWLSLDNNSLSEIRGSTFRSLKNLNYLYLGNNELMFLHPLTFQNQSRLKHLELHQNQLRSLPEDVFLHLTDLHVLHLAENSLNTIPDLTSCMSLQLINLTENPLLWINSDMFSGFNESVNVLVSSFATCCYVSSAQCISHLPRSPFLTCKRLLTYELRIIAWLMSVACIVGNIFSLYTRFKYKRENNKIQFLLISNLSASDLIMCTYLITLLSADIYYTDYFPSHSYSWRTSNLCRIAGALSILSSEASAFFITLISIDRFLAINYACGCGRMKTKVARALLGMSWIVAFGLSITAFVLSGLDSYLYSVSEVCVGLPISRSNLYIQSRIYVEIGYPMLSDDFFTVYQHVASYTSMYFSIAMFTGLNLLCFIIVGICYISIFITIRKNRNVSEHSHTFKEEIRVAMKMSLLVFTDFLCWVPIGILSILVQIGVVTVNPTLYVWIAVTVLPINSVLNPFLYTLSGVLFSKESCRCRGHTQSHSASHVSTVRTTSM